MAVATAEGETAAMAGAAVWEGMEEDSETRMAAAAMVAAMTAEDTYMGHQSGAGGTPKSRTPMTARGATTPNRSVRGSARRWRRRCTRRQTRCPQMGGRRAARAGVMAAKAAEAAAVVETEAKAMEMAVPEDMAAHAAGPYIRRNTPRTCTRKDL